jgi:hypothetical protein
MDHSAVQINTTHASCGIVELYGLTNDTEKMIFNIATSFYHPARGSPPAFAIWSTVQEKGAGDALEGFIRGRGDLGKVEPSEVALNPKTANFIRLYTWKINHEGFKAYYKAERLKKAARVGASI